jgi:hypothetical protein
MAVGQSDFVENSLSDFALAELAPFPVMVTDHLIKVLDGRLDGPEPDLGLILADLLQLGAAGEVQKIGLGSGSLTFAVGFGHVSVEDETNGFEPRLRELFRRLELTRFRNLLDWHALFPESIQLTTSNISVNLTKMVPKCNTKTSGS